MLENLSKSASLLVTLEDGIPDGGFGQSVLHFIHSSGSAHCQILSLGIHQPLLKQMKRNRILELNDLTAERITERILEFWHKNH